MHFSTYALTKPIYFGRAGLLCFAFLVAFMTCALISSPPLQAAGTVTVVDGPNTAPAATNAVFNDAYIQEYLNVTGSLTISTANSTVGGVQEIRVEPGVVITWTSGNTLTLNAAANIVVSGTLQQDGPGNGSGGVALLAGGDVQLGSGAQPDSIAVGSRFGWTRVEGENVRLRAGDNSATRRFVLLGFRAEDQGDTYTVTGPISVTAQLSVTAFAGANDFNFVQIGHGGATLISATLSLTRDGNFVGDVTIRAKDIYFAGGGGAIAYAQAGNGGYRALGAHGGDLTLIATQAITFNGGNAYFAFAQVGNGSTGVYADNFSGNHTVIAQNGDITFIAGPQTYAFVQVGNGGLGSSNGIFRGVMSGNQTVMAPHGDVVFRGNNAYWAYAQVGNGGGFNTNFMGNTTIMAGGNVIFTAGNGQVAYVQAGNGGGRGDSRPLGNTGDVTIGAQGGNIAFSAGEGRSAYAQAGNGGYNTPGTFRGNVALTAGGHVTFLAANAQYAYAIAGNGGSEGDGRSDPGPGHSGNITITAQGGDITFLAADAEGAYVQAGNGGYKNWGAHSGNVVLTAEENIIFSAGNFTDTFAQAGNGGDWGSGRGGPNNGFSGNHRLTALHGDIRFSAGGGEHAYALVGNGGLQTVSDTSGDYTLVAQGDIIFTSGAGDFAFSQVGNALAEGQADGMNTPSGMVTMTAQTGDVALVAGTGRYAYSQIGNGGFASFGVQHGNILIQAAGTLTVAAGSGEGAYARIGHGDVLDKQFNFGRGERSGDITLLVGDDLMMPGGRIGHVSTDGPDAVTDSNTYIAVSQNAPTAVGTGVISASNTPTFTVFNSAPAANGGELRFYIPRKSSVTLPANTPLNGELYPGAVPDDHVAGVYLFDDGPYIEDYSFYLGSNAGAPALEVSKTASVSLAHVGESITYTYRITNSGGMTFTAINAVDDPLGAVTLDKSALAPDDVASGQRVYIVKAADLPGPLTNTVTITATPLVGSTLVMTAEASVELAQQPDDREHIFLPKTAK